MNQIGSISKLLEHRTIQFANNTNEIFTKFSDRLIHAFSKLSGNEDRRIIWTKIELIDNTDKVVFVHGIMTLKIGETISIGDKVITLDETNVNQYNRILKMGFPIIMLELATVDELAEHIVRMNNIGTAMNLAEWVTLLETISSNYHEAILNDPAKLEMIDSLTKPEVVTILGFTIEELTDTQINQLKLFENEKQPSKFN